MPLDDAALGRLVAEAFEGLPGPEPARLQAIGARFARPAGRAAARLARWWLAAALAAGAAAAWWAVERARDPSEPPAVSVAPAPTPAARSQSGDDGGAGKAGDEARVQPPAAEGGERPASPIIMRRE